MINKTIVTLNLINICDFSSVQSTFLGRLSMLLSYAVSLINNIIKKIDIDQLLKMVKSSKPVIVIYDKCLCRLNYVYIVSLQLIVLTSLSRGALTVWQNGARSHELKLKIKKM